jgi:hypothetical protein
MKWKRFVLTGCRYVGNQAHPNALILMQLAPPSQASKNKGFFDASRMFT